MEREFIMARTAENATIELIASTTLTTLDYAVPASTVATAFLVLTNLTTNILDVSVYINNTATDFLLAREKIPAGIGKTWIVSELATQKLNAGFSIKVQCTTTDSFNASMSVSEINLN